MSLISVIVPCYNQAQYLSEALDSILAQTYTNWECVIVNDGSPDNTHEVALDYCKKDKRFKYIEKKNGGLASARNAGLEVARGQFIQFLDADDLILCHKFNKQLSDINKSGADVCICNYEKKGMNSVQESRCIYINPFPRGDFLDELISDWEVRLSIPCHCIIFKRTLVTSMYIRFKERLSNHEDWVFWVELFLQRPATVQTYEILCYYIIRKNSMASNSIAMKHGFLAAADCLAAILNDKADNLKYIELLALKVKEIRKVCERSDKSFFFMVQKRVKKIAGKIVKK